MFIWHQCHLGSGLGMTHWTQRANGGSWHPTRRLRAVEMNRTKGKDENLFAAICCPLCILLCAWTVTENTLHFQPAGSRSKSESDAVSYLVLWFAPIVLWVWQILSPFWQQSSEDFQSDAEEILLLHTRGLQISPYQCLCFYLGKHIIIFVRKSSSLPDLNKYSLSLLLPQICRPYFRTCALAVRDVTRLHLLES